MFSLLKCFSFLFVILIHFCGCKKKDSVINTMHSSEYFNVILGRLKNADAKMFDFFGDYRHEYSSVFQEIEGYRDKVELAYLLEIEQILNTYDAIQEKVRLIGMHLREHKFADYDWRKLPLESDTGNLTNPFIYANDHSKQQFKYSLFEFANPPLRNEHYDIVDECDPQIKKAVDCIHRVADLFSKNIDLEIALNASESTPNNALLAQLAPFTSHLRRWQYRTTSFYYLCYFVVKRDVVFTKFGKECKTFVDPSLEYYYSKTDDSEPFGCAFLSFCPDFCYGKASKTNANNKQKLVDFLPNTHNPCHRVKTGQCELSMTRNLNIESFKSNDLNVSCDCEAGKMFLTKFGVCIDIDECDENRHNCNGHHETCLNTIGSFECTCKRGYKMKYYENRNSTISETNRERKCVRVFDLEKVEEEIEEENKKYNRDILINLFRMIHENKTLV